MALLEVRNLSKTFGTVTVLKGIDLTIEKGQILSIIGSSGSGKTTLLRCINFLETANTGTITLNGEVIFDENSEKEFTKNQKLARQLKFGMVFQQFNLFPQYSVKKNLTLVPELFEKKKKLPSEVFQKRKEEISAHAEELLQTIALTEKADYYPSQLSGGQQQRVAIARALMLEPEILCFDEPTSALDPELTGEVLKVIKGLKSSDRTMIVVTHEMEFAKSVSDVVVYMANGVVEEIGTPEQVFEHPKSEKLKQFLKKSEELSL